VRVLVTGAAGYLGEHVALAFREAGHDVTAMVRQPKQATVLDALGIRTCLGDLERPESWNAALEGQEGMVHLAGAVKAWSRDHDAFRRVNVVRTLDLVERASQTGIPRILVTSSLFVLGPSPSGEVLDETAVSRPRASLLDANDYVRTKREAAEGLWKLQRNGHRVMLVYPSVLLGPGQRSEGNHTARVLSDVGAARLPGLIGNGDQVWNLVAVKDAARGHVAALERGRPGDGYFLGGENWTQRRLVDRAAHYFGVRAPLRPLGRALPLTVAAVSELWARATGGRPKLTRGEVRLYDTNWAFTSAKAERELGYAHENLEPVLEQTVHWLRASGI
jgi:dihydroflavonol-4-reductase